MRALQIAAAGMTAQQMRVEVISNNLANMNTTGYNARRAEFADLHYQQLVRPGTIAGNAPLVEVTRFEQGTGRLFAPLGARSLQLGEASNDVQLRPRNDGTVDASSSDRVHYLVTLAPMVASKLGGPRTAHLRRDLLPYVNLPGSDRIAGARDLAATLVENSPADLEQHLLVALLSDHLSNSYSYLAPGSEGAARTLDDFLEGSAGGHCEFFASALATMLRSLNVPCRVVTGFRSSNWDDSGRVLSFGTRDAHAWVEVHDPRGGWYAVDPSPIQSVQATGPGLWARLRSASHTMWAKVTGFDSERRAAFLAWARSRPSGRISHWRHSRRRRGIRDAVLSTVADTVQYREENSLHHDAAVLKNVHPAARGGGDHGWRGARLAAFHGGQTFGARHTRQFGDHRHHCI